MAQYGTDFSNFADTAALLQQFVPGWANAANLTVSLVTVDGQKRMRMQRSGGGRVGAYWALPGDIQGDVNVRVLCTSPVLQTGGRMMVFLQSNLNTANAEDAYFTLMDNGTNRFLRRWVGGSLSTMHNISTTFDGRSYWIRLRKVDDWLGLKIWSDGDTEPLNWNRESTGQNHMLSGFVGLGINSDESYVEYQFIGVGTGTDSAPSEPIATSTAPTVTAGPTISYGSWTRLGPKNTPAVMTFTATDPDTTGTNALSYEIVDSRTDGTVIGSGTATSGVQKTHNIAHDAPGLVDGTQTIWLRVSDGVQWSDWFSTVLLRDILPPNVTGTRHTPKPVLRIGGSGPPPEEPPPPPPPPEDFTYFVDAVNGNNNNNGTSPETAWRTLAKVSAQSLSAGQSVGLRRGQTFLGFITVPAEWVGTNANRITIGAYGEGSKPIVETRTSDNCVSINQSARWIVIDGLNLFHPEGAYGGRTDSAGNLSGFINGVVVNGQDIFIQNCIIRGNANGVLTRDPSRRVRILNNVFTENQATQSSLEGGVGVGMSCIQARGHGHFVDGNVAFNNAPPFSPNRSTFIELFKAQDFTAIRNQQLGDRKFAELGSGGGVISENLLFAFNTMWSHNGPARFIVGRGEGPDFGPVYNTQIINNTVWLTGGNSEAIVYGGAGENLCTIYNNIIVAFNKGLFKGVNGEMFEDHNIWHRFGGGTLQLQNHTIGPNSLRVNPQLINPPNNLRPQSSSPAWNAGRSYNHGVTHDIDGNAITGTPHIGAFTRP